MTLPAQSPVRLAPEKFRDPVLTAKGERRAQVALNRLRTLWINTGSLCNLTCTNCYIESSPVNDRLAYISAAEVADYLDEIQREGLRTEEIGFTGGEPFMNPEFGAMLEDTLHRGLRALVLSNGMRPMMKMAAVLERLARLYPGRIMVRFSIDHYGRALHESERGARTFSKALDGVAWAARAGLGVAAAGRTGWGEPEEQLRAGYRRLFETMNIPIDATDPEALVLFPEMDRTADVPEITEACWGILGVSPDAMMCASSRMVVKRKGAAAPVVLSCTLVPYDPAFELGRRLADAAGPVPLNHPHCARFCVLGGGACSRS